MEASVIIPFYNAEKTLARAIDSVLAQQKINLEILLVDNNSTDKSNTIAIDYVNNHKNISLHLETKQGATNARNLGLQLAKKEWIQYLDADDELLPTKIYNQLSIEGIDNIDVISSPIMEQTNQGKKINYQVSEMNDIWLSLLLGKIGWTCSNLWRKSALIDIEGWNTNYTSHQEKELMSRLIIEEKQFYFYDKAECIVYEQKNSISKSAHFPLTGIKFMKYISHHLKSHDILTSERQKAIHNQLYHKYLIAFKVNPEQAMNAMYNTNLNLDIVDKPFSHHILISMLGLQNAFRVISALAQKK